MDFTLSWFIKAMVIMVTIIAKNARIPTIASIRLSKNIVHLTFLLAKQGSGVLVLVDKLQCVHESIIPHLDRECHMALSYVARTCFSFYSDQEFKCVSWHY